jgi:hypothetical protein
LTSSSLCIFYYSRSIPAIKAIECTTHVTRARIAQVGARLIAHAGSLTNLAKYPASTVQILGAEKALFR